MAREFYQYLYGHGEYDHLAKYYFVDRELLDKNLLNKFEMTSIFELEKYFIQHRNHKWPDQSNKFKKGWLYVSVFCYYLGFLDGEKHTYKETAEHFSITLDSARIIFNRCIRILRHPIRRKSIESMLKTRPAIIHSDKPHSNRKT